MINDNYSLSFENFFERSRRCMSVLLRHKGDQSERFWGFMIVRVLFQGSFWKATGVGYWQNCLQTITVEVKVWMIVNHILSGKVHHHIPRHK